jgi:hypothetical protein
MDHSGQKVCILGEIQNYVANMLRASKVCYSPQKPQHIAKPQNVEGGWGKWNGGTLEGWNTGRNAVAVRILGHYSGSIGEEYSALMHHSITPLLHHSSIPVFRG